MQRRFFERAKSIAGPALVVIGTFILCEHLDRAAIQLSELPGNSGAVLGALPAAIFAASRVVQALAADHQRFLEDFVKQILLSAWPLLLVMVGTVWSRVRG